MSDLKDWIAKEMTVDIASELAKYKERVKDLIQLTTTGDVIIKKSNLTAKQRILIYLIGKVFSKVVGYSASDTATNKELMEAIGLKEGTVKFNLFDLRNEGLLNSPEEGVHQFKVGNIATVFEKYFKEEGKQNE